MKHYKIKPIKELAKLSATPPSIIHPYPLLALAVFVISKNYNLLGLLKAVIFSMVFQSAVNLWNHINDVEEDRISGRRNIIMENTKIRKISIIIVVLLYFIAGIVVLIGSFQRKLALFSFFMLFTVTWMYSDKIYIGKIIPRLKSHYITELLTYLVAIPTFLTILWCLNSDTLSKEFEALVILTILFMLQGVFLKDLKDISADRLAGLRTLGVVFEPYKLIKASFLTSYLYYFSIFVFAIILRFIPEISIIAIIPIVFVTLSFVSIFMNMKKCDDLAKPMKNYIFSNLISFGLLILVNFSYNFIDIGYIFRF